MYNVAMPFEPPASGSALPAWLAARIVEHLKGLGLAPGDHITEQALANHFRVSRTPVRQALAALAAAGAVQRQPNRGYFLAQPPAALGASPIAAPQDDKLYYRIAEDRLRGRIPQRVTESELARKYRVSRARMSTTLARMAEEGWLERLPGHGWAFQPMLDSVKGYEDGYRFRAVIEPAALRQPGYHLPAEAITRQRALQRDVLENGARYSDAEIFAIGCSFHEAIVGASGNPFLIDSLRRVNSLRRLLEYRAKRDRQKIAGQYREHLQLLDLIEAGKLEKAAQHMERHLDIARKTKASLVKGGRKR